MMRQVLHIRYIPSGQVPIEGGRPSERPFHRCNTPGIPLGDILVKVSFPVKSVIKVGHPTGAQDDDLSIFFHGALPVRQPQIASNKDGIVVQGGADVATPD